MKTTQKKSSKKRAHYCIHCGIRVKNCPEYGYANNWRHFDKKEFYWRCKNNPEHVAQTEE